MRALTISRHGGLDVLELRDDLPRPTLRTDTDVRVRVDAVALNHLDLYLLAGLPGVTITPPFIVGTDATGVVTETGSAATGVTVGDRVIINAGVSDRSCEYCLDGEQPLCPRFHVLGEHVPGLAAEEVVVPAWNVRAIPATVPVAEAAAFTLATLTAWRMLVTRARLQPGDDVLIWGIGGGVAVAALQVAKRFGARAWVTSGSDEKLARARELGADFTLNHDRDDVPAMVRAQTGKRGVDIVVDSVGEATWERSLRALGRRGRLVTCGGTSGPLVTTDVRRLFWNQWDILGSTMGNDAEFSAIAAELGAGRLLPVVDRAYPMEEAQAAYARLQSAGQFGKIVLRMR
ncbi:MAG: Alcohol dehydrogenase zinc-binding domain protein [Gemmatimonadetes bacterium]|nr:Alcohol dehydrogenase zinc-binding domain protein [Gemmatimonadota bacterium]